MAEQDFNTEALEAAEQVVSGVLKRLEELPGRQAVPEAAEDAHGQRN